MHHLQSIWPLSLTLESETGKTLSTELVRSFCTHDFLSLDEIECLHGLRRYAKQLKCYQERYMTGSRYLKREIECLLEPVEASINKISHRVVSFSESLKNENRISEAMLVTRLMLSNIEPSTDYIVQNNVDTIRSYILWSKATGDACTTKSMQELLVSHLANLAFVDENLLSHEVTNLIQLYRDSQQRQFDTIRRLQLILRPNQIVPPILQPLVLLGSEFIMSKGIETHIQTPEATDGLGRTLLHLTAECNHSRPRRNCWLRVPMSMLLLLAIGIVVVGLPRKVWMCFIGMAAAAISSLGSALTHPTVQSL